MKKLVFVALLALVSFAASAEVAPLGQVIGTATLESVKKDIGQRAKEIYGPWPEANSGRPALHAVGESLGINDLAKAIFTFNDDETLVSVNLLFPKHRYADLVSSLKAKYTLTAEQKPFVGNRHAIFDEGNVRIIVRAPHLDRTANVYYTTREHLEFYSAAKERKEEAEAARDQSQL